MRLHRLRLEAFGPFGRSVEIDFERLADAGLFLLHGPTGAGKTSVLDGICFALYGQVPGARAAGRPQLRSDHAVEGVAPRVLLELTVGGRRLEVSRSPEWNRPKKRGTGTTREPAATDVRELVDGQWQTLVARRSDEAGLLLRDMLGMGLEEFTKVVMLPQGDFAAFLRAGAEQRADLLARLFDIDQYRGVEGWLRDQRQDLARVVGEADAERDRLLARAHEVYSAIAQPPTDLGDEMALAAPPGPEVLDAMVATAEQVGQEAEVERADATLAATEARGRVEWATREARRRDQHEQLTTRLRELDEQAAGQAERKEQVRTAVQAERLRLLMERLQAADDGVTRCRDALTSVERDAAHLSVLTTAAVGDLPALLRSHRDELVRLDDAGALVDKHQELTERVAQLTVTRDEAAIQLAAAQRAADDAAASVRTHRQTLEQNAEAAAALVPAARALDEARRGHEAAVKVVACEQELSLLGERRRAAQDDELTKRGELLDVRERRLSGMAAELAAGLLSGDPCPVCGGADHPRPAHPVADPVDDQVERRARDAADASSQALREVLRLESSCQARASALRAACGGLDPAAAAAQVSLARAASERAVTAQEVTTRTEGALEAAERAREQAEVARVRAERGHISALAAMSAAEPQRVELSQALDQLRGQDQDVQARGDRLRGEVVALERLLAVRDASSRAAAQRDALERDVESAAVSAGFSELGEARAALRSADELATLEKQIAGHDRERQEVMTLLDSSLLDSAQLATTSNATEQPALDVPAAELASAQATATLRAAEHRLALAEQANTALRRLAAQLRDHDDVHRDVRVRSAQLAELSRCVDGSGGGNALRMRLSAYVLAARLEEVAAAASERLTVMSDGRFTLEHTDTLARSGARSGLGLRVIDAWTGTSRETASLSGGETFLASLSLALGLADVVSAESGGASIETLFVDEGFGTLDDETLEEVMGVLDALREGGRAVGLVSHVADLRDRIPAQVAISKGRAGSSIRQVGLDPPVHGDGQVDLHAATATRSLTEV